MIILHHIHIHKTKTIDIGLFLQTSTTSFQFYNSRCCACAPNSVNKPLILYITPWLSPSILHIMLGKPLCYSYNIADKSLYSSYCSVDKPLYSTYNAVYKPLYFVQVPLQIIPYIMSLTKRTNPKLYLKRGRILFPKGAKEVNRAETAKIRSKYDKIE